MANKGSLFLIPNVIAAQTQQLVLPPRLFSELPAIRHFLAEDIRTARRYLSSLKIYDSIEALDFKVLDKNTPATEIKSLLEPLQGGHHVGVLSESGCPGIADPGAQAVLKAHELGIEVIPLVGPSSILLALMASGLNGQRFAFQGYLPIDAREATVAIKNFEKESRELNQTQVFIETPYRNNTLFQNLVKNLKNDTLLTIACDITGATEFIATRSVKTWRAAPVELPKLPVVFLFLA